MRIRGIPLSAGYIDILIGTRLTEKTQEIIFVEIVFKKRIFENKSLQNHTFYKAFRRKTTFDFKKEDIPEW